MRMDDLSKRMDDQSNLLRELTHAVSKLAILEERQSAAREGLDRAFQEIRKCQQESDALDVRVKALEIAHPANKATASVVQRVGWLITAAVVGALLTLVLNKQPTGTTVHMSTPPGAMPNLSTK